MSKSRFTGATIIDRRTGKRVFIPYPSVDAYLTHRQMQRKVFGTNNQKRFWLHVPVTLWLYGVRILKQLEMRLAA